MGFTTVGKNDNSRVVNINFFSGTDIMIPDENFLMILLIKKGSCLLKICEVEYKIVAPAIVCLNDRKKPEFMSSVFLEVETVLFDPTFINRNMTFENIRNADYSDLVEKHCFFQLSPFFEHNEAYHSILNINNDLLLKISTAIKKCRYELENQDDWYWSCRARSYFMEILMDIERIYFNYNASADVYADPPMSEEFSEILTYVHGNINNLKTIYDICHKFSINRTTMQNLFKNSLGMTYYEYISMQRIQNASNMLRFTSLLLDEIAVRTGYSSTPNFCKFFKRIMHISPEKFRKQEVKKRIDWQNSR